MKKGFTLIVAGVLLTMSCNRRTNLKQEDVWVPVYKNKSEVSNILTLPAKYVSAGGKIYAYRDYVFQLEQNQGIHVYKLENKKPVPFRFIQVYGAQEISIKDNYLYTNNFSDIVVINISNPDAAELENRVQDAFVMSSFDLPPAKGYFQCVDNSKGVVVGWEKQHNVEADCIY